MTSPRPDRAAVSYIGDGDDARVRGEQAITGPGRRFLDLLGRVPQDPDARDRWIDAAGRVAQNHARWGVPAGSTHEEHEHLSQWLGRPVDPAEFDVALVNAHLQMVR